MIFEYYRKQCPGRPFHLLGDAKNTGAWKGRLKRFFVDPYAVELAKNGTNII